MNTRLRFFALAAVGSMTAFAGLLVACGDDDDSGSTNTTDSGVVDSSKADTSTPIADSGSPDVVVDLPDGAAVNAFRAQVDTALCGALTRCCFGSPSLADGGAVDASTYGTGATYDGARCAAGVHPLGFENSNVGLDLVDESKLVIDPVKAVACISAINALTCDLPGTELAAARATCFSVLTGATAVGQACTSSIACVPGSYCKPTETDGSFAGTCTALAGDGGTCSTFPFAGEVGSEAEIANATKSEEACSTRGGGDTKLHCKSYDPAAITNENPNGYQDRSLWKCVPQEADNAPCNSTVWCSNEICDPTNSNFVCTTPVDYFNSSGACASVVSVSTH